MVKPYSIWVSEDSLVVQDMVALVSVMDAVDMEDMTGGVESVGLAIEKVMV